VVYTGATLAFYLLGAAVLGRQGKDFSNADMIPTLSRMYVETFGPWSLWLFLIGAAAVLYSTIFGATAANTRLITDALQVFGWQRKGDEEQRRRTIRTLCVAFPVIWTVLYLLVGEPLTLVLVGAIAQGLMLPFLAVLALRLHYKHTPPELRPGLLWRIGLWSAAACMVTAGAYQVASKLW
jgi:Mn2+/Fe2+ NRAMP family transporter